MGSIQSYAKNENHAPKTDPSSMFLWRRVAIEVGMEVAIGANDEAKDI